METKLRQQPILQMDFLIEIYKTELYRMVVIEKAEEDIFFSS